MYYILILFSINVYIFPLSHLLLTTLICVVGIIIIWMMYIALI
jgi:hypothetical protein